jgi:mono/diheme cytochrome c family protein
VISSNEVQQLTSFVETRSGKSGLLRYAGQLYAKHVATLNQGYPAPPVGFAAANRKIVEQKTVEPPPNQLEEAPNLSQIDRSYWLSANPLPVTEGNLLRGKEVFLQRCVGCHGVKGDGKGPAAPFLSPPPADFTSADDACCGGDTGPGDFYYRILRGWPGTAMENFGERLSVDDIWRVVLFVKTIPKGTLRSGVVPEPKDYIAWQPSKELKAWLATRQKLTGNASFEKSQPADPYIQEAERVFPGLAPRDRILVPGLESPLDLRHAAAAIRSVYRGLLDRAWADAARRGEHLPPAAQKDIPPTVPGQQ